MLNMAMKFPIRSRDETRDGAVLDWDARVTQPPHAAHLALTRKLLAARKQYVMPLLPRMEGKGEVSLNGGILQARWPAGGKSPADPCQSVGGSRAKPSDWLGATPSGAIRRPDDLPPWSVYAAIGS